MSLPNILIAGDSHTGALKHALARREAPSSVGQISVARIAKTKNGTVMGDASLKDLASSAASLSSEDALVLAVGGNNYSVFGLVQHPVAFDVHMPDEMEGKTDPSKVCIPFRVVEDYFAGVVGKGADFKKIHALTHGISARRFYLTSPPPKEDVRHIMRNPESVFASMGLLKLGVSPPALLLKLWRIQCAAAEAMCAKLSITVLRPPSEALTSDGFLQERYYGGDATHANIGYGELVLRQIERMMASGDADLSTAS